jgi:DNA-3-methyladenine glycosylase II
VSKKIADHLKKTDPILYQAFLKSDPKEIFQLTRYSDPFINLCREIITQQLAQKAAHAIFTRFLNLFPDQKATPEALIKIPDQRIRDIGASWAKVKYLKDLSQKIKSRQLDLKKLDTLNNEEVIENLTIVKGIGRWTAEMFLIFYLGREDIFSHGDLGLKRAIEKLYKLKDPSREDIEKITSKWSPFRSYASKILWKTLNNEP